MALKANVQIVIGCRNGKSFLQKAMCQSPYKIADVTEDKRKRDLVLMLMSSSPGVLDGDETIFHIDVAANASLRLETQSYQRIFQMKKGACQTMMVNLQEGSSFCYLPSPVVPHSQSIFSSRNKIYLSQNYSLQWGEVISCGRKLNNEVFQFTSYHNITEIFLNEKLVVKENLLLRPDEGNITTIGQLEGFTHQASFLYLDENCRLEEMMDVIHDRFEQEGGISFGISVLSVNGFAIRILGHKAEQLFGFLKQISTLIETATSKTSSKKPAYV